MGRRGDGGGGSDDDVRGVVALGSVEVFLLTVGSGGFGEDLFGAQIVLVRAVSQLDGVTRGL